MPTLPQSRFQRFEERAALAFAEAIIPGSPYVPAADEATVRALRELLDDLDPRLGKAWSLAQATLSAAAIRTTLRPFHLLSASAQDALLEHWENDPVLRVPLGVLALAYKFVHFDRKPVYERMGGRFNEVTNLESPRWLEQIQPGDTLSDADDLECDVVVVGTGAGGAVVGRDLVDRGHSVVFVEEGEHYRRDSFDGSSVRAHQRFYRMAFSVGNVVMPIGVGRMVGGSTAINTGTCFRTPPWILQRWCEQLETDEFSPAAMNGYFDQVETVLEVAPSPRSIIGPIGDIMARGAEKLGWSHAPLRRNAPGCDGGGFCDFGCRTDARKATQLSFLPPALEKGALLFTGLRADRVLVEAGRATGVDAVTAQGRHVRIRAKTVVLAGGAIPTPLLLLKQGIANGSGQVGRNLTVHPSSALMGLFDDDIRGAAHVPQGYHVDHFLREGILMLGAQADFNLGGVVFPFSGRRLMDTLDRFDHLGMMGVLIHDGTSTGRVWRDVGGVPAISYNVAPPDVDVMQRGLHHAGELALAAGATRLYPAVHGAGILDGRRGFDAFRKRKLTAGDIFWASYHPLGTCRMGRDPKTSVIGLDHQVHEVPGLFIVDGSSVPTSLGVNPQVTIMGMALRAGEKIAALIDSGESARFSAAG